MMTICEHAEVPRHVKTRGRHEATQAREELVRAHVGMGSAAARAGEMLARRLGQYDELRGAALINNLAILQDGRGLFDASLDLFTRALEICELELGPDHPEVGLSLHNVADAIWKRGNPDLALAFGERVLAIREKTLGLDHPLVAYTINNLAVVHAARGDHALALALHQRALEIRRNTLGPESADRADREPERMHPVRGKPVVRR